jgi:hypothetical protein
MGLGFWMKHVRLGRTMQEAIPDKIGSQNQAKKIEEIEAKE